MSTIQPSTFTIQIPNPSLEDNPRTYLTADIAVAGTDLPVLATTGFVITGADDYHVIAGDYNQEKSEIKLVDASDVGTDATGFTVAALSFSHAASDPISFIAWNQIRFYGMTSATGDKNLLTTKDLDVTKQFTEYIYDQTAGATSYTHFCAAYYNSTDDEISEYTDILEGVTFGRKTVKRIIKSGLRKAMTQIDESPNSKLTWDIALEVFGDGIDEIITRKRKWSFLRKIDSTSTDTVVNQAYVDKLSDISLLEFLIVDDYSLTWMSLLEYNTYTKSGATITSGSPTHYTEKNNKYYLYPTPNAVYDVTYEYYKIPAIVSTLSTEIDSQFIALLVYYCASQFALIRGNDKRSDKMYIVFQKLLEQQVIEYSGPDQTGQAESIEQTAWVNLNLEELNRI